MIVVNENSDDAHEHALIDRRILKYKSHLVQIGPEVVVACRWLEATDKRGLMKVVPFFGVLLLVEIVNAAILVRDPGTVQTYRRVYARFSALQPRGFE